MTTVAPSNHAMRLVDRAYPWARRNGTVVLIYAITATFIIVASLLSPTFGKPSNFLNILRQSIVLGLVTIGQLFVMLAGGIDMSVGMTARVIGLAAAVSMTTLDLPPPLTIGLALLAGFGIGLLNGTIVARLGAQPFIATLGTMAILYGVGLAISRTSTKMVPAIVLKIYDTALGPVPISVMAMALIWLVTWWVLRSSKFGRSIYAVGGSPRVARLAGLNGERTVLLTYAISGLASAAAGLFLIARSGVGNPNMATGLEFQSIVAAAIGGISLYGGRGTVIGAAGAVILISVISNLFDLFQISAHFQDLTLGLIVVFAVAAYRSDKS